MGELLPEFWSAPNEEAKKEEKGRRTRKVRDIFTWLECFASYVAVRVMMTTRADGIPVHDCEGEPGFRGIGLGKVRCSLQEAGSTNGKHQMVSDKLHPLTPCALPVRLQTQRSVSCVLLHHTRRRGSVPSQETLTRRLRTA